MFYKHQNFLLDDEKRQVFDENGKKLIITGNSYLMFQFLCQNGKGTVTEIADAIDNMADLDEDDLRQLRHKIKIAIGTDLIKYENHIYRIDGEIKKSDKLEEVPITELPKIEKQIQPKTGNKKVLVLIIFIIFLAAAIAGGLLWKNKKQLFVKIAKPANDIVLIPAGNFILGSTEKQIDDAFSKCEEKDYCNKNDYLAEYPQRDVYLKNYYIDRKEVSNSDYELFVSATGHAQPQYINDSNLNSPVQPVVGVTWYDAEKYCQWAGERLPTEVEWEKAARGTDGRIFPWGNIWDGNKLNHGKGGDPGFDASDGFEYTAPVGYDSDISPYGVLNMAGNVQEWVNDDYRAYPGNDKYTRPEFNNPLKVTRGGNYTMDESDDRAAVRYFAAPGNADNITGFRCAKDDN
jgi:sulfatase modifying factor 1